MKKEECGCSTNELVLGETTIGNQCSECLLAYIIRDTETIYVDDKNIEAVTSQLKAIIKDGVMIIRKGEPFKGDLGFVLLCNIKPMCDLPKEKLIGLADGKVLTGHVCLMKPPGYCVNRSINGIFTRSFKAPSYGISTCYGANDSCDTWVAQEVVDVYKLKDCQGPFVTKRVSAYVCAMP